MKQPMKMVLARHTFGPNVTLGTLYTVIGQTHKVECFTVEDADRLYLGLPKKAGVTAIPTGTYEVILNMSPKFERILPRILDVPGFTGVLIHPGNWPKDTDGCVLTAGSISKTMGRSSTVALRKLMAQMKLSSEITLEVTRQDKDMCYDLPILGGLGKMGGVA